MLTLNRRNKNFVITWPGTTTTGQCQRRRNDSGEGGGGGVARGRLSRLRDKQQGDINIQLLQKGN